MRASSEVPDCRVVTLKTVKNTHTGVGKTVKFSIKIRISCAVVILVLQGLRLSRSNRHTCTLFFTLFVYVDLFTPSAREICKARKDCNMEN